MKKQFLIATALIGAITFQSCKDEEDPKPEAPKAPSNPQEIITTVQLFLIDGTGDTVVGTWRDIDGDGPGAPQITGLTLKPATDYLGGVLILDESKSPVDTVSNEITEEDYAHQFFYTAQGGVASRLAIQRLDRDSLQLPVGQAITVNTNSGAAATGNLNVVLKHYDGIAKSTDPTVGETDVEVNFPVTIQN